MSLRKYISRKQIEELGIQKYRKGGLGLTFEIIEKEFYINKAKAQRTLKYFHGKGILFTANDLRSEGMGILYNKSPQQYFPACIKSDLIEGLNKRKNVLVNPTGATSSSGSISYPYSDSGQIVSETLEGYILPLLPESPLFIHNIHLKLKISPEHYLELSFPAIQGNKGKRHSEIIGTSYVDCTFYPNGTVTIEVKSSNHPFKLQSEEDRSRLLVFFGQVRQALMFFLCDNHERIVPHVLEWDLTECDINKDIKISDCFHFTSLKIQVKHLDHIFSLYVKSMGKDTALRIEERKHPNKSPLEFINDTINPVERLEKRIAEMNAKLSSIHDLILQAAKNKC